MANSRKSLRKTIWPSGSSPNPRDIGEALRDVDQAFKTITALTITTATNVAPLTPFVVAYDHAPQAVLIGRAVVANSSDTATWGSSVSWTWNGTQIVLNGMVLLGGATGTTYNVTLLIFG